VQAPQRPEDERKQVAVGLFALVMGLGVLMHLPHAVVYDGPATIEWVAP
jgi:hypothetical protein